MTITESIKFNKVKELIVKIKQEIKLCNSALALKTLENLINKYENELAEKDRKIDLLLTANKQITYSSKSREYNQQQLYKEDFIIGCLYCIQQDKHDKCLPVRYFLKKYSEQKYDKLSSKEDKTCI